MSREGQHVTEGWHVTGRTACHRGGWHVTGRDEQGLSFLRRVSLRLHLAWMGMLEGLATCMAISSRVGFGRWECVPG